MALHLGNSHIQPRPTLAHLHKTMTVQTCRKKLSVCWRWYAYTVIIFCSVCFHPQRYKGERWESCGHTYWGTPHFSIPLSNEMTHFEQWGQPDGCFPEARTLRDTWGILSRYLYSGQMITFKSLSEEYSWIRNHLGQLGLLIKRGI